MSEMTIGYDATPERRLQCLHSMQKKQHSSYKMLGYVVKLSLHWRALLTVSLRSFEKWDFQQKYLT